MSSGKWVQLSESGSVAFAFPCERAYHYIRVLGINVGCAEPDERHGHLELTDEEGLYAFIPFRCYSQAGVQAIVEYFDFEQTEFKGIPALSAIKSLPVELTEQEKLIIASPDEMKKWARIWGWFGN